MLSSAILFLQRDSLFAKKYSEGKLPKSHYWEYYYEDASNLIAKIPRISALIYRHKYHNDHFIEADNSQDWAGNYSHMLGFSGIEMKEYLRGYMTIYRYLIEIIL